MIEGAVVGTNEARERTEDWGVGEGLSSSPGIAGGGAEGERYGVSRARDWVCEREW